MRARNKAYTKEEWIQVAKQVWGEQYDYRKVIYKNSKTKVTWIETE